MLTENQINILINLLDSAIAMSKVTQPDRTLELELRDIKETLDNMDTDDTYPDVPWDGVESMDEP